MPCAGGAKTVRLTFVPHHVFLQCALPFVLVTYPAFSVLFLSHQLITVDHTSPLLTNLPAAQTIAAVELISKLQRLNTASTYVLSVAEVLAFEFSHVDFHICPASFSS